MRARRPAAPAALGILLLTLTGCAQPTAEPTAPTTAPTPTPEPTPAASATDEPADVAGPDAIDTSGWHEFATDDGSVAFRYPPD
ncbi:hypothetical protein [Agrococcus sp. ARC_14]|uniref:hypothetical protein n=1 Tax=Agrococcus sp. ARC_14 TaxID=2919927 RepID=UPI001F0629F9|nr:hypothetical protein [Agrococcus sp. ARC_14]MCH1884082.1 hypothetical protein [Agrococcus sp. ARC_14]